MVPMHGSVAQADVYPQVSRERHAGGVCQAYDCLQSRSFGGWSFGCICASVYGLDGGYRLFARSELGDVLDDSFDSGVEVEGVGKRGQVCNARGSLHHEVVSVG